MQPDPIIQPTEIDWWATARMIVNGDPAGTPLPARALEHQPREHPVPCQGCRTMTWARDALCSVCRERTLS